MSYGIVDGLKGAYTVSQLCGVLDVNKSSYYYSARLGLLFHSDQGFQYTSHAYQERLAELGMQASIYALWV